MQNSLQPTYYFDCDHPDIRNAVQSITGDCKNQVEVLQQLFLFVRDQIPYNMYAVTGNQIYYKASKILEMGIGYCVQKAILLTTLGRAAGVPSRLVLVAIRNHLTPPDVVKLLGGNIFFPMLTANFSWKAAGSMLQPLTTNPYVLDLVPLFLNLTVTMILCCRQLTWLDISSSSTLKTSGFLMICPGSS